MLRTVGRVPGSLEETGQRLDGFGLSIGTTEVHSF